MAKTCERCGADLANTRDHFCPRCRAERREERQAANMAQQRERWRGTDQICEMCKKAFRAEHPRRRCDACNFKARQEQMRRNLEARAAKRREKQEAAPPREDKPWRREDGVLVLPPAREQEERRRPKKPGAKADPESLEVVLYELYMTNEERAAKGLHRLRYGQFVSQRYMTQKT